MKIALFSDIHGNITGLNAVLQAIEEDGGVDETYCLGDLFDGGAGHVDLLDLLIDSGVAIIKGNHEEGALRLEERIHTVSEPFREWSLASRDWLHTHLGQSHLEFIDNLPVNKVIDLPSGKQLCLCHAAPDDFDAKVCAFNADNADIETYFGHRTEDIFAYGHFHNNHILKYDGKLMVNVASVGLRYTGVSNFTILEESNGSLTLRQLSVPYDLDDEIHLMKERKVPLIPLAFFPSVVQNKF